MKKKIAILTQPLLLNYGGIIQNYALQKVLKDLGHEPITINRRYNKNNWLDLKIRLYHFLKNTGHIHADEKQLNMFFQNNLAFMKKHIRLSDKINSNKEFKTFMHRNPFDVYIVGSDQTWRPKYSPNIYEYYLDFLEGKERNEKRIAYASSFGTEEWEYTNEETERVSELVKEFDAVSVREKSGVDLCENFLNTKAEWVLDPTLLLNASDYIKDLDLESNTTGENKLYTYVLDRSTEKLEFLDKISKDLVLDLANSQPMRKPHEFRKGSQLEDFINPPLENWLAGFKNADLIITDSFHGTVFSILFQKPFISLVNKERGASRFESFLSALGLEHRMLYDTKDYKPQIAQEPIDYEKVNLKLEELRKSSFNFLKENI